MIKKNPNNPQKIHPKPQTPQTDKTTTLCLDIDWKECLEIFLFLASLFWCGLHLGLPKKGELNSEFSTFQEQMKTFCSVH